MITANEARKNYEEYIIAKEAKRAEKVRELTNEIGKNIEVASKQGNTECTANVPFNFCDEVCAELAKVGFTAARYTASTIVIRWD